MNEPRHMSAAQRNLAKLPAECMVRLPATGEAILVVAGEPGYYAVHAKTTPEQFNEARGITKAQAAAMLHGSMFGWHVPAADADNYDENGDHKSTGGRQA